MRKATTESYRLKSCTSYSLFEQTREQLYRIWQAQSSRIVTVIEMQVFLDWLVLSYQNVSAAGGLPFRAWLVKRLSFIVWVVFKWVLVITLLRLLNNLSKNVNFCLLVGTCHWIFISYHINLSNYFIISLLFFSFNFYFLLSKVDVLDIFFSAFIL